MGLRSAAGGRNKETYSEYAKEYEKISIRAEGSTSKCAKARARKSIRQRAGKYPFDTSTTLSAGQH